MSPLILILALAVIVVGAAVQGSLGFGASLVSIPLLLLIDPRLVPGPAIVAGLTINVIALRAGAGEVDWRGARWAVLGLLPGTLVAAVALTVFTGSSVALLSAGAVLAAVAVTAVGVRLPARRRTMLGAGFFSGYLTATAGVGGPPMALAYQDAPPPTLRATLPIVFLSAAVLTMITLTETGHLSVVDWGYGILLAPGGAIGYFAIRPFIHHFDPERMRVGVLSVSALSAVAAIVRVLA